MDRKFIDNPVLEAPRLYIIMRSDLYQMNPGKGMAQAAHAATKFMFDALAQDAQRDNVMGELNDWAGDKGFGTKITLSATLDEMKAVEKYMKKAGKLTGMVVDPTYPYSNFYGEFFTAEETTCMYVFATTDFTTEDMAVMRQFKLHQ